MTRCERCKKFVKGKGTYPWNDDAKCILGMHNDIEWPFPGGCTDFEKKSDTPSNEE